MYFFSAVNKHPYVGGKKPAALEPNYVLTHFPDIECATSRVLRECDETSEENICRDIVDRIVHEVVLGEQITLLKCTLKEPQEVFHTLTVKCTYPKVLIRKKEHEALMAQQELAYYNAKVRCADTLHLCALTKGHSRNVRWVLVSWLHSTVRIRHAYFYCQNNNATYFTNRWHQERRVRITCSLAHTILRSQKPPQELADALLRAPRFSSTATSYDMQFSVVDHNINGGKSSFFFRYTDGASSS